MYFNGSAVNLSYVDGEPKQGNTASYNYIKLFGNQKVNYVRIENKVLSDDELDQISYNDVPEWDSNSTAFLSLFNKDLESGNVKYVDDIQGYSLQRFEDGSNKGVFLKDFDADTRGYEDLSAAGNNSYIYQLIAKGTNTTSMPLVSPQTNTNWYNWCLADPKTKEVFTFDLNVQSSEIKNAIDRTSTQTFTKYNKISYGNTDYMSSSLSCLLALTDGNGEHTFPVKLLNQLKDFINNHNYKYLKARSGNIWVVDTYNFGVQYIDDVPRQPNTISFSWDEVQDSNSQIEVGD